jgi:hypothetical protein
MGEVYRATDTKLGRDVAIKVLPAEVASDSERLARFEREARLLASLNHPNVAQVYGFEGVTTADGSAVHFLAMELVPGEDLAERLKRGRIPIDETLKIARQIAEALAEAHEKGIVHRDHKPANVKLTPDGKVKVLDFGLAKAYAEEAGGGSAADLSQSPTLAHTGTQAGVILGTAGRDDRLHAWRRGGLSRVSAAGGAPEIATIPDPTAAEMAHRWPQALSGGRAVLYTAHSRVGDFEGASIVVQPLPSGPRKVVQQGGYHGRYVASGHLVYMHEGTLFAAPFDVGRLERTGQPVPVLQGVTAAMQFAGAQFAFSDRGTLVFLPGRSVGAEMSIQWMDREGQLRPLPAAPNRYWNMRFSPAGRRLAMDIKEGRQLDVWVQRGGRARGLRTALPRAGRQVADLDHGRPLPRLVSNRE